MGMLLGGGVVPVNVPLMSTGEFEGKRRGVDKSRRDVPCRENITNAFSESASKRIDRRVGLFERVIRVLGKLKSGRRKGRQLRTRKWDP
jgi:hypothetical protein